MSCGGSRRITIHTKYINVYIYDVKKCVTVFLLSNHPLFGGRRGRECLDCYHVHGNMLFTLVIEASS